MTTGSTPMDDERFDALLEAGLAGYELPPDLGPDERDEIEGAVARARAIRATRASANAQASISRRRARARFNRFLESQPNAGAVAEPIPLKRRGFLAHRRSLAAIAAGFVLLVSSALLGSQVIGGSETASAQVLTAGDYVQLEGVVETATVDGTRQEVTIRSALGDVALAVDSSSSVLGENPGSAPLEAGAVVTVSGVVAANTTAARPRVIAHTIGVSAGRGAAFERAVFRRLTELRPGLSGRVLTFVVTADGSGRALIQSPNGSTVLVPVDARSTERLLRLASALGAEVSVQPAVDGDGNFALDLPAPATTPGATASAAPTRPSIAGRRPEVQANPIHIDGIIVGRIGPIMEVRTQRGTMAVRVAAHTRVLLGESGIAPSDFSETKPARGHSISVTGGIDRAAGVVIADVIVIGPLEATAN